MKRASGTTAGVLLAVLVVAGCAGPRTVERGPAPRRVAAPAVPPADTPEDLGLARDEPAVLAASKALGGAAEQDRPALLLARAREAVVAGQKIRGGLGITFGGSSPGYQKYLALYDLAQRDLEEVATRFPGTPEGPEARFMLGLVNDYPHLDDFEEAERRYLLTVETYPRTEWAQRAADRIRRLEAIRSGESMPAPGGGR